VRNNNEYPYNNLFLIVSLNQPGGKVLVDTLEYQMAYPDGSLMGTGFQTLRKVNFGIKKIIVLKKLENTL